MVGMATSVLDYGMNIAKEDVDYCSCKVKRRFNKFNCKSGEILYALREQGLNMRKISNLTGYDYVAIRSFFGGDCYAKDCEK